MATLHAYPPSIPPMSGDCHLVAHLLRAYLCDPLYVGMAVAVAGSVGLW